MSGTVRARALFVLLGGFVPAHLHTVRIVRGKRGADGGRRPPVAAAGADGASRALPVARAR
jgi:hypothetical protein